MLRLSCRLFYPGSCWLIRGVNKVCLLASEPILLRGKGNHWRNIGLLGAHASSGSFEDAFDIGSGATGRLERVDSERLVVDSELLVAQKGHGRLLAAQHLSPRLAPLSRPSPPSNEHAACLCTRGSHHVILKLLLQLSLLAFVKEPQAQRERTHEDNDGGQHDPDEATVFFALSTQNVALAALKERVEVEIR